MFSSALFPITMSSGSKLAMEGPWSAGWAECVAPRSLPVFVGRFIIGVGRAAPLQWLRCCAPTAGGMGPTPGGEVRSHMPFV